MCSFPLLPLAFSACPLLWLRPFSFLTDNLSFLEHYLLWAFKEPFVLFSTFQHPLEMDISCDLSLSMCGKWGGGGKKSIHKCSLPGHFPSCLKIIIIIQLIFFCTPNWGFSWYPQPMSSLWVGLFSCLTGWHRNSGLKKYDHFFCCKVSWYTKWINLYS